MTLKLQESSSLACPVNLDEVLTSIDELPSIPETLIHILKVLDDPNSGASDLAQIIRLDAPLTAKILRLANSPYYSSRGDIPDISRCVAILGYRTVRQVALCVTVASSLVTAVARSRGRLDYQELWRHSVSTAAVAKHLALMAEHPDPEEVFTAGLLHDVGKFVLELFAPEAYDQVIYNRAQSRQPLVDMEEETFGFSHADIGEAFARSWRFPESLVRVFGNHHGLGSTRSGVVDPDQNLALVALADYLANTLEPPHSDLGFDPRQAKPAVLHKHANLTVKQVEDEAPQIRHAIRTASTFLSL